MLRYDISQYKEFNNAYIHDERPSPAKQVSTLSMSWQRLCGPAMGAKSCQAGWTHLEKVSSGNGKLVALRPNMQSAMMRCKLENSLMRRSGMTVLWMLTTVPFHLQQQARPCQNLLTIRLLQQTVSASALQQQPGVWEIHTCIK